MLGAEGRASTADPTNDQCSRRDLMAITHLRHALRATGGDPDSMRRSSWLTRRAFTDAQRDQKTIQPGAASVGRARFRFSDGW